MRILFGLILTALALITLNIVNTRSSVQQIQTDLVHFKHDINCLTRNFIAEEQYSDEIASGFENRLQFVESNRRSTNVHQAEKLAALEALAMNYKELQLPLAGSAYGRAVDEVAKQDTAWLIHRFYTLVEIAKEKSKDSATPFGDEDTGKQHQIHAAFKENITETNLEDRKMLMATTLAIRLSENGRDRAYGIIDGRANTYRKQVGWCAATVQKNYDRWQNATIFAEVSDDRNYLTFLRDKYAPLGADNDPTGLNVNWLPNVKFYQEQLLQIANSSEMMVR